ncbi:unnamed protein product [Musa acuminata var. zebrina]
MRGRAAFFCVARPRPLLARWNCSSFSASSPQDLSTVAACPYCGCWNSITKQIFSSCPSQLLLSFARIFLTPKTQARITSHPKTLARILSHLENRIPSHRRNSSKKSFPSQISPKHLSRIPSFPS